MYEDGEIRLFIKLVTKNDDGLMLTESNFIESLTANDLILYSVFDC